MLRETPPPFVISTEAKRGGEICGASPDPLKVIPVVGAKHQAKRDQRNHNFSTAPTINGRAPCLLSSRKLVRKPTPAKVSRKAQRERFPNAAS